MLFALGLCENLGEPQTLRVEKTIFHAMRLCLWIDPKKKTQPFSAHAEVSPWIHRAQLLHCLQMFSLFFLSSRILGFTPSTVQPFFWGELFRHQIEDLPSPPMVLPSRRDGRSWRNFLGQWSAWNLASVGWMWPCPGRRWKTSFRRAGEKSCCWMLLDFRMIGGIKMGDLRGFSMF